MIKVLYANPVRQGGVIAQLSQMNVPYRHADGGGHPWVPRHPRCTTRASLAAAGLPWLGGRLRADGRRASPDAVPGTPDLPARPGGELTRSITEAGRRTPAPALPNQNGFSSSRSPPVMLTFHLRRTLERARSPHRAPRRRPACRQMIPAAVSVLDRTGALLTGDQANPQAWAGRAAAVACGAGRAATEAHFELLERRPRQPARPHAASSR